MQGLLLDGKVAVITGGASGMGQASVLRFLEEGAKVVIADNNRDIGEETLELARAQGASDVRFIQTDVSSEADIEAAIALAVRDFGGLDIMFANAGIAGVRGPLTETTVEGFERTFAVNVRGVFLALKHGGRVLRDQGRGGSMIATTSDSPLVKLASPPVYTTSKAAANQLVREFAVELAPLSIRVNGIAPGAILTPMYGGDLEGHWRPILQQCQPLPTTGEPIDVANMAVFLASPLARFVSGTIMVVDGGKVAEGGHMFMKQFAK